MLTVAHKTLNPEAEANTNARSSGKVEDWNGGVQRSVDQGSESHMDMAFGMLYGLGAFHGHC